MRGRGYVPGFRNTQAFLLYAFQAQLEQLVLIQIDKSLQSARYGGMYIVHCLELCAPVSKLKSVIIMVENRFA